MTWRAYLLEVSTGRVGKRLDLPASPGSGTIPLCDVEDLSLQVHKSSLEDVDPAWYAPLGVGGGGILVTHESPGVFPETPIFAGPILDDPAETRTTAAFTAAGIGEVLRRRFLLARDYGTSPAEQTAMRRSKISLTGLSLGGVMRRIVYYATHHKPSGQLPIVFDSSDPATGTRIRTYDGWNLANNEAWKRIQETSEVINGPDFAFRPRWVDPEARDRIEWLLVHGTELQPRLPQQWTPVFDARADDSPVASVSVKSTAADAVHRVYATGSGEGAGTKTVMRERLPRDPRVPLVEAVISDTSEDEDAAKAEENLGALASGTIASGRRVTQITIETMANAAQAPLGRWNVGDLGRIAAEGWLRLPDGDHDRRIIAVKFDLASEGITVEFQEDPE